MGSDSKNKSPIRIWREKLGLGVNDLACIVGLSRHSVTYVEQGYSSGVPVSWKQGVERLGASYDDLSREYTAWRIAETTRLLQGR
jgi:hypothetical protein